MRHDADLSACLTATRDRFVARIAAWCPVLEDFRDSAARGPVASAHLGAIRIEAHKIAGSGRIFGFADLSGLAADLEGALERAGSSPADQNAAQALVLAAGNLAVEARRIVVEKPYHSNGQLIRFPAAAANAAPRADKPHSAPAETHQTNAHILIVDDDDLMREALVLGLARRGWRFSEAKDGLAAISALFRTGSRNRDAPPDLVLLDVDMPRMDGFETLGLLKASPLWRYTPVIMLTRRDEDVDQIRGLAGGAQDYLPKPFELTVLATKIETMLAANRPQVVIAIGDAELGSRVSKNVETLGIEAVQAKSPKHAVAETRECRTSLAIIDAAFPHYDGKSVAAMIRADADARRKPLLSLHAEGDHAAMLQGLRDGDHDSLVAPIDIEELMARVEAVLRRAR